MDTQTNKNSDWQDLAQRASEETDPKKLMDLVRQLNEALEKAKDGLDRSEDVNPSNMNPSTNTPNASAFGSRLISF
ncbi:MAG TPA: hypothetical protein VI386_31255 [Candidatus Sulfotelmatobacter sp.]